MAWSENGVDQMARLRATKANGVSVRQLYVEQYRQGLPLLPINPKFLAGERQKLKKGFRGGVGQPACFARSGEPAYHGAKNDQPQYFFPLVITLPGLKPILPCLPAAYQGRRKAVAKAIAGLAGNP